MAGRTDNIKIVNGGNKLFGGGNATAGMARIEIKSEPKGAQVIVNGTPLQKATPVEIQVEAGSYDVTSAEGWIPAHARERDCGPGRPRQNHQSIHTLISFNKQVCNDGEQSQELRTANDSRLLFFICRLATPAQDTYSGNK